MSSYQIIDEPNVKAAQHLIVNPIAIVLAAMLIPMFYTIPFYGKFWLPFVWLMVNSFLLGSPTLWKELFYSVIGLLAIVGILFGYGYGIQKEIITSPNRFSDYLRLSVNTVFFIALYMVLFTQSVPFSIFEYVKQSGQNE